MLEVNKYRNQLGHTDQDFWSISGWMSQTLKHSHCGRYDIEPALLFFFFLPVIGILSLYSSEWNPKRIKKLLWGWKRIKNRGGTHAALILYYLAVLLAVQQLTAVIRRMYRGGLNEGCHPAIWSAPITERSFPLYFQCYKKFNMSYSHITTAIY